MFFLNLAVRMAWLVRVLIFSMHFSAEVNCDSGNSPVG